MKHLRLSEINLDRCPEGLGQLDKLESLDLSSNRIGILDPSTGSLFKLKTLDIRGNSIEVWGAWRAEIVLLVTKGCAIDNNDFANAFAGIAVYRDVP